MNLYSQESYSLKQRITEIQISLSLIAIIIDRGQGN